MNALRDERSPGLAAAETAPQLATTSLEEGLARLEYLVAAGRRAGLVTGPAGAGKTYLARQFVRNARRSACDAALVDLTALDSRELLWNLLAQLGVRRTPRDARFALWRSLADRLAENRFERRPIVLLFDGVDDASMDVVETILRLMHLGEQDSLRMVCVLLARSERLGRLDPRLVERVELRMEMEPWNAEEIEGYVRLRLAAAALPVERMEPTAIDELGRLTGGEPRDVTQLAELATVVQQDLGDQPFDGPTMVAVFEELSGRGVDALPRSS